MRYLKEFFIEKKKYWQLATKKIYKRRLGSES